jgi:hypothetical protein
MKTKQKMRTDWMKYYYVRRDKNHRLGLTSHGKTWTITTKGYRYGFTPDRVVRRLVEKPWFKKTDFFDKYGMTMTEMAKKIGVSKETISKKFKKGEDLLI